MPNKKTTSILNGSSNKKLLKKETRIEDVEDGNNIDFCWMYERPILCVKKK